jgi:hypothetical protein
MGVKYDALLGALRTTDTSGSSGGGDLHYETTFSSSSSLTVNHNLNKKPAVTVIDSAGDEVEGDIDHTTNNQFTVTFSASFSGTVFCN